ncbi:DUF1801 domain-containing protein [Brevundimonas sp.]|uniref:DUF1801 domain-containing protein n=1 Tax=Brevundimonas sp. TaxID=1871086 RepID=UPI0037C0A23D
MTSGTETYLDGLADDARQLIDALRTVVRNAVPTAVETIKWNAPSFAVDGQDRITLGLDRKGGARLVLHCGAKTRASVDLTAVDHDSVAQWPSLDRGVVVFRDLEDIRMREVALTALCSRWVEAAA